MKTLNVKSTITLGLTAAAFFMMTSCQAPSEREAKVAPATAANMIEVKSVNEVISSKSVYVSGGEKKALADLDSSIKQIKLEGSAAESILAKVKGEKTKKALEAQLKDGGIALLVLRDQVKVLKVTNDVDLTLNYDVVSSKYLEKMKQMNKALDVAQQSSLARELRDLKYIAPKAHGEKFGMVELTSIKIAKMGILDNVRTDYNEKKAVLDVKATPMEMATHIVLGDEEGAAE